MNLIKGVNKIFNKNYNAENCEICKTEFSLVKFKKIHKCKRCDRYICKNCGNQKAFILDYEEKNKREHRICSDCKNDKQLMNDVIHNNGCRWNQNSNISRIWLSTMRKSCQDQEKSENLTYKQYLEEYNQNKEKYHKCHLQIQKDVQPRDSAADAGGRTDYDVFNYSLKEFMHTMQENVDKQQVRDSIENVLVAYVVKNPQFGYSQGMNSMVAFLLCFSTEETAFILFDHLITEIYPRKFFQLQQYNSDGIAHEGCELEQFILTVLIQQKFGKKLPNVVKFVEFQFVLAPYLQALMERNLNFGCMFYLWNEMFTSNSFVAVEKCILAYLKINSELISQNFMSADLKEYMLKSTHMDQLKCEVEKISLKPEERKLIIKQFYKEEYFKLRTKKSIVPVQIGRLLGFDGNLIEDIQDKFNEFCEGLKQCFQMKKNKYSNQMIQVCYIKWEQFSEVLGVLFEDLEFMEAKGVDFLGGDLELNEKVLDLFGRNSVCSEEVQLENVLLFENFLVCLGCLVRDQLSNKLKLFFKIYQEFSNDQIVDFSKFWELFGLLHDIQEQFIKKEEKLNFSYSISNHHNNYKIFQNQIKAKYMQNQGGLDYCDIVGVLSHPFFEEIYNKQEQKVGEINRFCRQQSMIREMIQDQSDNFRVQISKDLINSLNKNHEEQKKILQEQLDSQIQIYSGDIIRIQNKNSQKCLHSSILGDQVLQQNLTSSGTQLSNSTSTSDQNISPFMKYEVKLKDIICEDNGDFDWEVIRVDYNILDSVNSYNAKLDGNVLDISRSESFFMNKSSVESQDMQRLDSGKNSMIQSTTLQDKIRKKKQSKKSVFFTLKQFETCMKNMQNLQELIKNGDKILLRHKKTQSYLYSFQNESDSLSIKNGSVLDQANQLFLVKSIYNENIMLEELCFIVQNSSQNLFVVQKENLKLSSCFNGSYLYSGQQENDQQIEGRYKTSRGNLLDTFVFKLVQSQVQIQMSQYASQCIQSSIQQQNQFLPVYSSFNGQKCHYRIRHLKTGTLLGIYNDNLGSFSENGGDNSDQENKSLRMSQVCHDEIQDYQSQKGQQQLIVDWQLKILFAKLQNKKKGLQEQNIDLQQQQFYDNIVRHQDMIKLENKQFCMFSNGKLLNSNGKIQVLGCQSQDRFEYQEKESLFRIQLVNPEQGYLGVGSIFRLEHMQSGKLCYTVPYSSSIYLGSNLQNNSGNEQWIIEQDNKQYSNNNQSNQSAK